MQAIMSTDLGFSSGIMLDDTARESSSIRKAGEKRRNNVRNSVRYKFLPRETVEISIHGIYCVRGNEIIKC